MKHRIFLIALLVITAFTSKAQINVQFVPEIYGRNISGLFNCQFINAGARRQATLTISVSERNAGLIAMIRVPEFVIAPGSSPLPVTVARSAAIQIADNRLGRLAKQSNMFPEGDYDYCFELTFTGSDLGPQEQCFSYALAPFADLNLIDPYDGESNCNKRPLFTWQPLIPAVPGSYYQLVLAEIKNGQSATEAINYNLPLINQQNITTPLLTYPSIVRDLETGKKYAWQVSAYKDQTVLNRSEIWEFTVSCTDSIKKKVDTESFREIDDLSRGNFYISTGHIKFAIVNSYEQQPLNYEIVPVDAPEKKIKHLPKVKLEPGKNFIDLDISALGSFKNDKYYLMNISLRNGVVKSLRFVYKNEE
ncbi:DUF928 domain-containing protein [Mucilaginibacter celer]|uniref:DUF928 domain-containing protein n=1 Tax=Mucilaginibacter celer TaxID=2305508 RepID=A0A494VR64_9SPHI|nr:DUF928 domain-containing protein [Mucilaginibacter celer]AYL93828.1 DUF928 domain-containing protein [Mucilaginibacter celer]